MGSLPRGLKLCDHYESKIDEYLSYIPARFDGLFGFISFLIQSGLMLP